MSFKRSLSIALLIASLSSVVSSATLAQNTDRSRPFTPHPATAMERAQLDEDFAVMMSWLEGEWSSEAQVAFQEAAGIDESLRYPWHHDHYVRINAPALGENVFYTEKQIDGKVFVQQYWVLTPLYESRVIENSIYLPKVRGSLPADSWKDPEKLSNVKLEDVRSMAPGCSTYWQRRDNHFDVEIQGECRIREIDGERAYHGARSAMTPTTMLMYLFELNSKGEQVGGNMAGLQRELKKVGGR